MLENIQSIDLHVHYPAINENLNMSLLKPLQRFLLKQVTIPAYSHFLKIKYTTNLHTLRYEGEKKLIESINNSSLSHAVVFGIDTTQNGLGEAGNFFWNNNDYIFTLSKKHKKILPGISINPIKKSAISELIRYSEMGAALVKIHPSFQNFDPSSSHFIEFCRVAKQQGLPILIHTGFESAVPGSDQGNLLFNNISRLEKALNTGCTIIAAHGGGSPLSFFGSEKECFKQVTKLLSKYKNLYLDISSIFNIHRPDRSKSILQNKLILDRCVYGSDFPNVSKGERLIFKIGLKRYLSLRKIDNIFNRDITIKRLLGFTDEVFSRGYSLINSKTI